MYFDELNPNLKSVCSRKFLIVRYRNCRVCLSATVPIDGGGNSCLNEPLGMPLSCTMAAAMEKRIERHC
jgi:hypothetical protein